MHKSAVTSPRNKLVFYSSLMALMGLVLSLFFVVAPTPQASAAQSFADPYFQQLWNRTDKLVNDGRTSRSFLWGPSPNSAGVMEDYLDAPGGKRLVQYFDKSRMEITNPNGDKSSAYYVTNGLIAKELMTGQLQLGDNKFEQREAANLGVAGDPDDTNGPTYKALERVDKPATSNDTGILVAGFIDRDGNTYFDRGDYGSKWKASYAYYEPSTKHNIAGPFWSYLNQTGPVLNTNGQQATGKIFDPVFFATGLPITEAYWAQVKVAGQVKDVLIQAFERRVLTFTPTNDPAYQVEMGNVGQHYYNWRYANSQPITNPSPSSSPTPTATSAPTSTPTPRPSPTATQPPAPSGGNVSSSGCLPSVSNVSDLVQACVSNSNPSQNSRVTVYGRLIVGGKAVGSGVTMNTTWNYKTTQSECSGTTDSSGVASCTRDISRASKGYTVVIDINFSYNGRNYNGSTSFTPQ
jgi:hypothetical protein